MTLSPEERAEGIVRQIDDMEGVKGWLGEFAARLIATAIREAENAALERAAQHIIDDAKEAAGDLPMNWQDAVDFYADEIRSLKSKD